MTQHIDRIVDCRLRAATELFTHGWDPLVLAALRAGPRRRRELRLAIGGISDKVLTESLHRLTGTGLVRRRTFREAPPRVDYGLTALGSSLVEGPLVALAEWITEHGDALLESSERADPITG
ncbi:winged helix-turn-helix transcriptional regulator [Nocardia cyriacigeorgica]|uniref:winged helix-turn-helix transcriptional regulator n=1 Tax=Nocardia cyriacigeorgica TaxID=135487 RepID=UPI0013D2ACA0|nr:helix-turn-helix domain-containing protein [Nocardia cyriacigeorgica]MBF6439814.1 helix-turn-helix transcriptional regulator [Nocardia cyriacigeorgica]NEW28124.1 helix-turn-helix transcriptional regulator [Nocardia cyriacigeorgica]